MFVYVLLDRKGTIYGVVSTEKAAVRWLDAWAQGEEHSYGYVETKLDTYINIPVSDLMLTLEVNNVN